MTNFDVLTIEIDTFIFFFLGSALKDLKMNSQKSKFWLGFKNTINKRYLKEPTLSHTDILSLRYFEPNHIPFFSISELIEDISVW